MSKAVQGIALLGASVVAGAFTLGVGGVALEAAFNSASWIGDAIFAGLAGGVAMEAGAIAGALTDNRGMEITTRQAAACRQIVYGQQRVGGVIIYQNTTGSSHDQFNYVIVLAGHEVHSFENLYLDGRQVHWLGSGTGWSVRNGVGFGGIADNSNHTGPNGVQYNFGGTGHSGIYCEARYGDQAPGDVIGALTANDPNWAASGGNSPWVAGCAYIYLKIENNPNLFPSPPEIRVTVNGKNTIFDPRTGTNVYTTNWALIAADVITDPIFGLGDNTVNQAQLIAAANVCDEQVNLAVSPGTLTEARYTTNYHYDTSMSPVAALSNMMAGAEGRLSRIGGEWYLWPAYWQGASFSFDESALTATMQWKPYRSRRDLFNRVNGTYIAPTYPYNVAGNLYDQNGWYNGMLPNQFPFGWQATNYPQYASDVLHGYASDEWLNEDGGKQLPEELDLPTVISVAQAQRVAKIHLLRNRQQGSGTFEMSLAAFNMQPTDVMGFTFANNGWSNKTLEVTGISFKVADSEGDNGVQSIRVAVNVAETDISVYEWSPTPEELTVYDIPANTGQISYQPAPPTSVVLLSSAGTAVLGPDGSAQPRIEVTWNTPLDSLVKQIQIQYEVSGSGNWIPGPFVDVSQNSTFIAGVIAGQTYDVRIRSVRANGATSDWVQVNGETVSLTIGFITQQSPHANVLFGEAFSDGTAIILVYPYTTQIGSITVSLLPGGPVEILGLSQGQLYWVYYIDPTTVGGGVTMIATQNRSDYLNKQGYYEVGSCVVPVYNAGSTGIRYLPTTFSDVGTTATANPQYAFDQDPATAATVSARSTLRGGLGTVNTFGQCTWGGFPPVVTTATSTLVMVASVINTGFWATIGGLQFDINIAGTFTPTAPSAPTVPTASTVYSATIPSGTDLSTVSLQVLITHIGSTHFSGAAIITEIYIQT